MRQPAALLLSVDSSDGLLAAATDQLGRLADELRAGIQVQHAETRLILLQLLPSRQRDESELLSVLGRLWDDLHALDEADGIRFLERYEWETGRGTGDYETVAQVFASILWQILPLSPANRLARAKFIYSLIPPQQRPVERPNRRSNVGIRSAVLKGASNMKIDYTALDMPNAFLDSDDDSFDDDGSFNNDSFDDAAANDTASTNDDSIDLPPSNYTASSNHAATDSQVSRIFWKAGRGAAFLALLNNDSLPAGLPQIQFLLSRVCWANGVSTDNCSPAVAAIAYFVSQRMLSREALDALEELLDEYGRVLDAIESCRGDAAEVLRHSSAALLSRFVAEAATAQQDSELFSVAEVRRVENLQCPAGAVEIIRYGQHRPAHGRVCLHRR